MTWVGWSVWTKQDFTFSLSTQKETFRDSMSFFLLKSQIQINKPSKVYAQRRKGYNVSPDGLWEKGTCMSANIGTGRVPQSHSTPPCMATGTLHNFPFVFLPGRDLVSVKMKYVFVLHEMSLTVGKTRTNPGTRNDDALMTHTAPTSAEAVLDAFSFLSIELALEKNLTQKTPDRQHPQWPESIR